MAVILSSAELFGTIPPEIQWMGPYLGTLQLYSNSGLVGSIPEELGRLSILQTLELHKTSLTGTLPTMLGQLTSLGSFLVYDTNVTGRMPENVCALLQHGDTAEGHLTRLEASCSGNPPRIVCDCCTQCRRPKIPPPPPPPSGTLKLQENKN